MRDHEIYSGCEGQGWGCLELSQKAWHGKRWRGHCMLLPLEDGDILVKCRQRRRRQRKGDYRHWGRGSEQYKVRAALGLQAGCIRVVLPTGTVEEIKERAQSWAQQLEAGMPNL